MPKETTEDALRRISRNIARMATSDEVPRTVIVDHGHGWRTVQTVYPPGYEHEPAENPPQDSDEEQDDRAAAPHNID